MDILSGKSQPIKVLATMNFLKGFSEPLVQSLVDSRLVNEVIVVSDTDMSQIPGIQIYLTPKWVRSPFSRVTIRGILRIITHFLYVFYLTIKKKPDIIIGFNIFPHCVYAFICAKLFKKPVIACMCNWPGMWRFRRSLLPLLKYCDLVTTTGDISREYLINKGLERERIYSRPDPTDTERFRPYNTPKKYDIIFVGRLSKEKNLIALLNVVDQVKTFRDNLKVCILGDGYLMPLLKQTSIDLGIDSNVEFLGYKENTDFYYNSSKILILTSLHEGLPRVMIEAMSCCIPCVVPNVGDIKDAAVNGSNAYVIEDPNDIHSYANCIVRLLDDNNIYNMFSYKARIVAEKKYSLRSATEAWDKILDRVG